MVPPSPELHREQPCFHLDSELLASNTVREYISFVFNHSAVIICYGSPRKRIQYFSDTIQMVSCYTLQDLLLSLCCYIPLASTALHQVLTVYLGSASSCQPQCSFDRWRIKGYWC